MTLQEKIKMWNEEEKPTEIDALLTELNIWVGKADSQEVRLCPLVLKNYLVEFGEIFASYKVTVD
jgi:hypothetical protein